MDNDNPLVFESIQFMKPAKRHQNGLHYVRTQLYSLCPGITHWDGSPEQVQYLNLPDSLGQFWKLSQTADGQVISVTQNQTN